ncbi:MAG: GNAT family N-acetyltransferase [Candidatus Melainabacteria bacterium]|nr:GNAT family N-acetyltransferase [Candidatus Melainabacteria bacterium]
MTQPSTDAIPALKVRAGKTDAVIRSVERGDFSLAVETWKTAFGFTDEERWKKFAFEVSDYAVGAFIDDYPHALATVIMFDCNFNGHLIKCGGIAGVACSPPMRRKGLVRAVLQEVLNRLNDQKVEISALWPFSYPFYEKMGYSLTDLQYEVSQNVDAIPPVGDSSRFKPVKLDDYEKLMPVHQRWTKTFNLSLERNSYRWQRQLTRPERQFVLYLHEDGYMIWNLQDPENRTLEVVEWAYLTEQAFHDGLALIKNCGQLAFDSAKWVMPVLDPLLRLGVSYPPARVNVRYGMMSRVVNSEAFFKNCSLDAHKVEICDPMGISGSANIDGGIRPGPGEVLQIAAGFMKPSGHVAESLYKKAANVATFSIEQY